MIHFKKYRLPVLGQKRKTTRNGSFWFYLLPFALCGLLSSCGQSASVGESSPNPAATTASNSTGSAPLKPDQKQSLAKQPATNPKTSASSQPTRTTSKPLQATSANQKTVAVNVYKLDNQCKRFVSEKVSVLANQPIASTIGKVLETNDSADFSLSGYRVNVASGVATIDLRVDPESRRRFQSLSSCEQLALFGSLRKTLTSNGQWKIKSVTFTDRGQKVVL